jgi:hypothetical protein
MWPALLVQESALPWKAYEESMPSDCHKANSGNYAVRHNLPAYYTSLHGCSKKVGTAEQLLLGERLPWLADHLRLCLRLEAITAAYREVFAWLSACAVVVALDTTRAVP